MKGLSIQAFIYSSLAAYANAAADMPLVDLGYEIHRAESFNATAGIYKWKAIRYAKPPVGELAFTLPQPPAENRSVVQDGSAGKNCYNAAPKWQTDHDKEKRASEPDKRDCLFLDVYTPKKVFEQEDEREPRAAVIVWIHGGGSIAGSKDLTPWGLMNRRKNKIIVVSVSYRLGAFGFQGGETLEAGGGTANLGLHDQRFALEWVQEHIHLFGGDKSKVTLMGESAGGGSTLYQITAFGGNKGAPFARAIPQSPSTLVASKSNADEKYKDFLSRANCANSDPKKALECLQGKTGEELQRANQESVADAPFGFFHFGPNIDDDFIQAAAGVALVNGQFVEDVEVMPGHNLDEGGIFTDDDIKTDKDFHDFLIGALPSASESVISEIEENIYPPPSNSTPYHNNHDRVKLVMSELRYTCATIYLAHAHGNKTYNYLFAVKPGYHSQDVGYTWYNGGANPQMKDKNVAYDLQDYIISFAIDGKPTSQRDDQPEFPMYGEENQVMKLDDGGEAVADDPAANERCQYWQKATYLG